MAADFKALLRRWPYQAAVLLATLALFLITNALMGSGPLGFVPVLVALLIVIEIAVFVGLEVKEGAQKHGWKHEVVDTIIALAVAVGIWYGLSFVLNTSTPISGVVSCSMLPNLHRGDFVIVQGAPVNAYEISMTREELEALSGRSMLLYSDGEASLEGSLFAYCMLDRNSDVCMEFLDFPESVTEIKGPFTYRYQVCEVSLADGGIIKEPCLRSVTFKGREYLTSFSHDAIVYQPVRGDLFSYVGDIVHTPVY